MSNCILVGCDVHDQTLVLKIAHGRQPSLKRVFKNTVSGRRALIADVQERARAVGAQEILFAYEASGQGFRLYDQLTAAGIRCVVLAPTRIVRSLQQRGRKTDERDAEQLLELLRAHVLAGTPLPSVWVPDLQTRDDREVVRMRLAVGKKKTEARLQLKALLKRHGLGRPQETGIGWTKAYRTWLTKLPEQAGVGVGTRLALASLLRQLLALEDEERRLDDELRRLAQEARYAPQVQAQCQEKGVGVLTAMVFNTELGDPKRFSNRRGLGSYMGLTPSSHESGQRSDCKGHITRQGPSRVRKVLCQAVWSQIRTDPATKAHYEQLVAGNGKRKKTAVVALMRRLGVKLWHLGRAGVDLRAGVSPPPCVDQGAHCRPLDPC